jgi:hypothetical protein
MVSVASQHQLYLTGSFSSDRIDFAQATCSALALRQNLKSCTYMDVVLIVANYVLMHIFVKEL